MSEPEELATYKADNKRLADLVANQNVKLMDLTVALMTVLDQVDYTVGACRMVDMVGACLDQKVIKQARDAIAKARGES